MSKPVEEKTREELIEQIRRLQDRITIANAAMSAAKTTQLTRMANYRKAARLANSRADIAEAQLRDIRKALAPVGPLLEGGEE